VADAMTLFPVSVRSERLTGPTTIDPPPPLTRAATGA